MVRTSHAALHNEILLLTLYFQRSKRRSLSP